MPTLKCIEQQHRQHDIHIIKSDVYTDIRATVSRKVYNLDLVWYFWKIDMNIA